MAVAIAVDPAEIGPRPPTWLGSYQVLGRIADGGMASIFRGQDPDSGEVVALKTVRTARPFEIAGLEREIATLRRLRHPGIVRFVAEGSWKGLPWMAMELLEGETLFDRIISMWDRPAGEIPRTVPGRRRADDNQWETQPQSQPVHRRSADAGWIQSLQADPTLSLPVRAPAAAGRLREAFALVVRLAPVLDYIHQRGIIHRDLKPENVFLGNDGRMTLLDFGVACRPQNSAADIEANRLGLGTMEYAAPEQICGEQLDARADVYSLGCILYELVTGQRPFEGASPEEIAQKHLDVEPVCPSDLVSGLSWQQEDLILAMLAKEPAERPDGAGDIARVLAPAVRCCS